MAFLSLSSFREMYPCITRANAQQCLNKEKFKANEKVKNIKYESINLFENLIIN